MKNFAKLSVLLLSIVCMFSSCDDDNELNVVSPSYGPSGYYGSSEIYAWIEACSGCPCNIDESIFGCTGSVNSSGDFSTTSVTRLTDVKIGIDKVKVTGSARNNNLLTWIETMAEGSNPEKRVHFKYVNDDLVEQTTDATVLPYGYELEHESYDAVHLRFDLSVAVIPAKHTDSTRTELLACILSYTGIGLVGHHVIDHSKNFKYPVIAKGIDGYMVAYADNDSNAKALLLNNSHVVLREIDVTAPFDEQQKVAIAFDRTNREYMVCFGDNSGNIGAKVYNDLGDDLYSATLISGSQPNFWLGKPIYLDVISNATGTRYMMVYHHRKNDHVVLLGSHEQQLQAVEITRVGAGSFDVADPIIVPQEEPVSISTESAALFSSGEHFTVLCGESEIVLNPSGAEMNDPESYSIYRRVLE